MTLDPLFSPTIGTLAEANEVLVSVGHYLGPSRRGSLAWIDDYGCMVWGNPTSRRLPTGRWLELIRWGLKGIPNGGSQQFAAFRRWALDNLPNVTTFVSYSDPSAGHTGALYRACNWTWAPTWHRLRPPPTGQGEWTAGKRQAPKDRWVFALRPDPDRAGLVEVKDSALVRRGIPTYREFVGQT